MKFIIAIDDTDNLESFSTGIIAEKLALKMEKELSYKCTPVVRHQLFLDERIRYTSQNIGVNSEEMSVKTLLTHSRIDEVQDIQGNVIGIDEYIQIFEKNYKGGYYAS